MPERIQRQRIKGWRMPEGAVYVGRPTVWGNPCRLPRGATWKTRRFAVWHFRAAIEEAIEKNPAFGQHLREQLAGRDLACWCPLDQPCHADALLEIANASLSPVTSKETKK